MPVAGWRPAGQTSGAAGAGQGGEQGWVPGPSGPEPGAGPAAGISLPALQDAPVCSGLMSRWASTREPVTPRGPACEGGSLPPGSRGLVGLDSPPQLGFADPTSLWLC